MLGAPKLVAHRLMARQNAQVIAAVASAKVTTSHRNVIGEPDCPYQVRLNHGEFWFGVRVSDASYVATGNHKRLQAMQPQFYASLKAKNAAMQTSIPLESISGHLGVQVFVSEHRFGPLVANALRSPECASVLTNIDFSAVRSMFLSPVQINVVSDLTEPREAAGQVLLLRSLLLALWQWNETNAQRHLRAPN